MGIDPCGEAGMKGDGGAELLEDGWAGDDLAGLDVGTPEHGGVDVAGPYKADHYRY